MEYVKLLEYKLEEELNGLLRTKTFKDGEDLKGDSAEEYSYYSENCFI